MQSRISIIYSLSAACTMRLRRNNNNIIRRCSFACSSSAGSFVNRHDKLAPETFSSLAIGQLIHWDAANIIYTYTSCICFITRRTLVVFIHGLAYPNSAFDSFVVIFLKIYIYIYITRKKVSRWATDGPDRRARDNKTRTRMSLRVQ